jgi:hypothetical protein
MACPGSIALSRDIPPRPSSEDAASGTCTHFLAYRAQAHDVDPMCYVGDELTFDGFTFKIDEERAQRVAAYVLTGVQTPGLKFFEAELDLTPVLGFGGQKGTADRICADLNTSTLYVDDLKDGHWKVHAGTKEEPNWQLVNYAGGAFYQLELLCHWEKIVLRIYQPRADHASALELTRAEFLKLLAQLATGAQRSNRMLDGREPVTLVTGPQCKFCPAAGSCPELAKFASAPLPSATQTLSDARLADLLNTERRILDAFAAFRAEATSRARLGSTIPGWCLTTGREGPRKWGSQVAVEAALNKALAGDAYKRELVSPTEAEKRLKKIEGGPAVWSALQSHVTRSPGAVVLAPQAEVTSPLPPNEFNEFIDRTGVAGLI